MRPEGRVFALSFRLALFAFNAFKKLTWFKLVAGIYSGWCGAPARTGVRRAAQR